MRRRIRELASLSRVGVSADEFGDALSVDAQFTLEPAYGFGRWTQYTCQNWTSSSATSFTNTYVSTTGQLRTASSNTAPTPPGCNTQRALACCNGAAKVRFAGFTSLIVDGAGTGGGRPGMHAACGAQFAGSHMCHIAEYLRTASATQVPATGAWLDPSGNERGEASSGGSPRLGRYTATYTCNGWTSNVQDQYNTTFLDVDGAAKMTSPSTAPLPIGCAAQRPIACCI